MRLASFALLWIAAGLAAIFPTTTFSQTPIPAGSEFQVHTSTANDEAFPAIAVHASGAFVITWHTEFTEGERVNGLNGAIFAQLFLPDGTPFGEEFQVNQQTSSICWPGATEQVAVAAAPLGNFVVVWPGNELYATLFAPDGTPILSEFQVNTTAGDQIQSPAIAIDGSGNFVITWMNFPDKGGSDIFARRFDNQGIPLDDDFIVNQNLAFPQAYPAIAVTPTGEFVITWQSFGQDGDLDGIFARRFNADGTPKANEFQVNTNSLGMQHHPDVGMNENGDFVITWASFENVDAKKAARTSNSDGIFARAYNGEGVAFGIEFPVNSQPGFFDIPAINMHPKGSFIITWFGFDPILEGDDDIFARRFGMLPEPIPLSDDFPVNSTLNNAQQMPDVAIAENRDFVITWQSFLQDENDNGIYAQRFQMPPLADAGPDTTICPGDSVVIGGDPAAFEGAPPYSYLWSPTDGLDNPTASNPKASPTTTTAYTLTVTDANENTGSDEMTVTVFPALAVDAGADRTICSGDTTMLGGNPTASGGLPTYTYNWSPTTGLDDATIANPELTLTLTDSTTFSYIVKVTDANGCMASDTVAVTVLPFPNADAGEDKTICAGDTTQIGGNPTGSGGKSPYTYNWSPTTGLSNATVSNPNAYPTETTSYIVTVTDANEKSATDTVDVTVNPTPVADAGDDATICSGDTTMLGGNPAATGGTPSYSYVWSPVEGLDNATLANPKFTKTVSDSNTFAIVLKVTDANGCMDTDTVEVTVLPLPIADAGSDRTICSGDTTTLGGNPTASGGKPPYSYSWTPAFGLDDPAIANPKLTLTTTTIIIAKYIVTVTDANGCTAKDTVEITVSPELVVNAGKDSTICKGITVPLGGTPAAAGGIPPYTYVWTPAAGLDNAAIANPNAKPDTTTTYILKVSDTSGKMATDTMTVIVHPKPIADAGTDRTICAGDTTILGGNPTAIEGTPAYSYNWSPATGLDNATAANPKFSLAPTTSTSLNIILDVTDSHGCTDSDTVKVNVHPRPIADAGENKMLQPNQLITIGGNPTATGGTPPYTFKWSPEAGLSNPVLANPTASVAQTTTFIVMVTDANGCTDSDTMKIDIATGIADETEESIPNQFSLAQNYPNPFNPTTVINYQLPVNSQVQLIIYDLAGRIVKTLVSEHQSAGHHNVTWDATDDYDRRVASGVYLYLIRAGDFTSQRKLILMK